MKPISKFHHNFLRMLGLMITFHLALSQMAFAQFVQGDELIITFRRGNNNCAFESNPAHDYIFYINNEQRFRTGLGGNSFYTATIPLKRSEMGTEITLTGNVWENHCTKNKLQFVRSIPANKIYVPFYESFSENTSITGSRNLPAQSCGYKMMSWDRVPTAQEVKTNIYDKPQNSFVVPKDASGNTRYAFTFNTGNRSFSKIKYYTGEIGNPEGVPDVINNPRSSFTFEYAPTSVYLKGAANYTRLLILECYNSSGQIAQLVAIPMIVTGSQTDYAKDETGELLTTKGAPALNMVLHNIPGDESFNYIEKNVNTCSEVSMEFADGNNQGVGVSVTVGTSTAVLGIVNIESEFSVSGSYNRTASKTNASSTQICRQVTSRIEHKSNLIGEDGDLFVGSYTTYNYGPSITVAYKKCKVEVRQKGLALRAIEMEDFFYTKYDIEHDIIPVLEQELEGIDKQSKEGKELDRNVKAWRDIIRQNHENIVNAPLISNQKVFYGGRRPESSEIGLERSETFSTESSLIIDASMMAEASVNVGGNGFGAYVEVGISTSVSKGDSNSETNSQFIGYSLEDNDEGDLFKLKIKRDQVFGTPVFELQNDSRTSCPYEGGYQLNQPLLRVLDDGVEKRTINLYAPPGTAVQVPLRIKNGSNQPATYYLSGGNMANAAVELGSNGIGLNNQEKAYSLNGNQSITLTPGSGQDLLYVKQNLNDPYQQAYEGIEIFLKPTCEEDREKIEDKVILNVYFEEQLAVDQANANTGNEAGNLKFNVTSNTNWTVSTDVFWLSINTPSGIENGHFFASFSENETFEARTGSITIQTPGGVQITRAITQAPAPFQCDSWTQVATEGGNLRFEGEQFVRYGTNGVYVVKKVRSGTPCDNGTFGDPIRGQRKYCYLCEESITDNSCSDIPKRALEFDGRNDYISFDNPAEIPTGNSAYTIEAWFYANTMGAKGIIGWGPYRSEGKVNALRLSRKGFRHYWWSNDLDATTGDITGAWHHVAATYDGTTRILYLDGVAIASDVPGTHQVPDASNLTIGKTFRNEYFDGKIDEVRIWNVARSEEQINRFMGQELAGNEAGLVAYFSFNQGTIGSDNDSERNLRDRSGNQNDGNLRGFLLAGSQSNWTHGANLAYHDSDGDGIGDVCDPDFEIAAASMSMAAAPVPIASRKAHTAENLGQNDPNPASETTTIPVRIPSGTQEAFLEVTAADGQAVDRIQLQEVGEFTIDLSTSQLEAGLYFYSLIVDGKAMGSKRMSVMR